MMLGVAQMTQGHLLQAEAQLSAAVQNASDNVEARKLLARVRLQLGQPDAALRALTPAVDADTADPQVYALLGSARLRSGNARAAGEALEQGLKANPADPELRLELARAYLAEGRSRDALQLLQEGSAVAGVDLRRDMLFVAALNAERGPAAARAQIEKLLAERSKDVATLNLGAAFFAARWEFERAHNLLQLALTLDARSAPTLVRLAQLDADTGDQAGAEAALRTALAANPTNVLVRLALSDLLTRRGVYDDAKQVLEAESGKTPAVELRLAMGQLHLARADLGAAAAVFDGVIAGLPDRADVVNRVGLLLLEARQFDLALVRFRRAAEMAPRNPSYWVNTGRAQLALDQSVAASESFQKALAQQPNMVSAVAALALIDVRAKKYDAALARVRSLRAERPNDADVLLLEGDVLATSGAYRDAADAYAAAARQRPDAVSAAKLHQIRVVGGLPKPEEPLQQWLALQPADFRVRGILANYYLTQHDLKQAASECEQILQQLPSSVVALNNLAWVYSTLGDTRAESIAERAQRLAPDSATVADTLGWILAKKRATDRALPLLEKAARGLPRDPEAQYHYAYALAQAGRRDDARAILSRALSAERDFPARQEAERLLADLKV
jgi:putative PEP-CTERM system TPR-repeat lipoprotein